MTAQPRALVDQFTVWNALVASFGTPIKLSGNAQAVLGIAEDTPATGPEFRVETRQGAVLVRVVSFPFAAVTRTELALDDLPALPPPLPHILWDGLRDVLLASLPDEFRGEIIAARRVDDGAGQGWPDYETMSISLNSGWPEPALLLARAPLAVFAALAMAPGANAPVPHLPQALADLIPIRVRLALRGRTISLRRLRALQPGDILLPPQDTSHYLLLGGRLVAALHPEQDIWTLTELAVTDHPELPEAPLNGAPAASLDDIPVTLSFVLETRDVPLSQIQALRPGSVLPFTPAMPAPGFEVQVLANGRTIGSGNIVEVDGRPAVRIARLFGQV